MIADTFCYLSKKYFSSKLFRPWNGAYLYKKDTIPRDSFSPLALDDVHLRLHTPVSAGTVHHVCLLRFGHKDRVLERQSDEYDICSVKFSCHLSLNTLLDTTSFRFLFRFLLLRWVPNLMSLTCVVLTTACVVDPALIPIVMFFQERVLDLTVRATSEVLLHQKNLYKRMFRFPAGEGGYR